MNSMKCSMEPTLLSLVRTKAPFCDAWALPSCRSSLLPRCLLALRARHSSPSARFFSNRWSRYSHPFLYHTSVVILLYLSS